MPKHRKKINISIVSDWQKLGMKEFDDSIWLVNYMHYDPGFNDLEQRTLQIVDNPFATRLSPMSWAHSVTHVSGANTIFLAGGTMAAQLVPHP